MDRYPLLRKGLAVVIVLLFVGTGIIPTLAQNIDKPSLPTSRGNWLYVGGSGSGNYTRIQDAIDNTSDGDTIFVFSGIYYENVIIRNSIKLIGEDRNNTIIDGNGSGNVIYIYYRQVLNNFTIRNGGPDFNHAGVSIEVWTDVISNVIISNCSIYNCGWGVIFWGGGNNTIINCDISNNQGGICTRYGGNSSRYNVIKNCKIHNNNQAVRLILTYNNTIENCSMYSYGTPISFQAASYNKITNCNFSADSNGDSSMSEGSNYNLISDCIFSNNYYGMRLFQYSDNNTIRNNTFKDNRYGITITKDIVAANNNLVYNNNFINNTENAYDECNNTWDNGYPSGGNYWSDYIGEDNNHDGIGDTPYNISGGNNQDFYPFMHPLEMYTILKVIIPNIPVYEGEDFPLIIHSLAGLSIRDAIVKFNDETMTTDSNGTVWFTAPQVEADTLYEITANKTGYTGANETILVKNMVIAFVLGKITNLSGQGEHIQFEAVKMRVITFPPFCFNSYISGEKFTISKDYKGLVGTRYIFAQCKILI